MAEEIPKSILILGGGTAGWVCGSVLAKNAAKNGTRVTIVDTADIPTIGVGEASIPTIYDLLNHVGLTDQEVIAQAEATFKYGIQFENWSRPGERYMHGFGNMGNAMQGKEFFAVWMAAARYFTSRNLAPFTPAVTAALKGRFARVAERPQNAPPHLFYPLCELSYALHFDASLLARLLKKTALENGATHLSKHITDVEMGEKGITALRTEDGETISADFFIDCSGLYGFLSRKTLEGAFEDWRQYLPCDSAIAVQTKRESEPNLYTRSIAHKAGWRWEIQLQHRTGNGCVYASDYMSDDEALNDLMGSIEGEPITEPRKIPFVTGRLNEPWQKNCAAIGLSAGFLEPLESTSIHLICKYALQLEKALYGGMTDQVARDGFNAMWRDETDEVRDFLMAHYVINQRNDDPFWKARQDGPRPDSLNRYLQEMEQTGWISLPDHALFGNDSWYQVLIGQQMPLDYNRFAASQTDAPAMLQFLENVARAVDAETSGISCTHQQKLEELVASA